MLKRLTLLFALLSTTCFAQEAPDVKSLTKKAEAGDVTAQIALGLAYDQGKGGLEQDRRKAAEWFGKAAAQGAAEAQFNLGTMYDLGAGVKKDQAKALEFFGKAAAQGMADAQFNLANMYATGRGTEQDLSKAIEYYDKAGIQGMTRAQYNLGLLYAKGAKEQGLQPNSVKAYAWLSLAA